MRNNTINGMLLTAAFAALATAPALAQVPDDIRNAPGVERFPAADGVLVRHWIHVSLDATGKVTRCEETAIKMLSVHVDREGYFDPHVSWNDSRSELKIDKARSYMVDGTVVDAKANSFVPNTPAELERAVPYAHIRDMVVAQVGVEHGGTTVLAYTITDRAPSGVPLWGVIELQSFMPILSQRIVIEVPEDTDLLVATPFCDAEPEVASRDGKKTYTIARENVPAANLSELGGNRHGVPRLVYSNAGSWENVAHHVGHYVDQAAQADTAVRAKLKEVLGTASLPLEKIAAIHQFVVEGIDTVDWPLEAFDFEGRSAGEVLQTSVGHSLDKAILLTAMLRAAGLRANVALAAGEVELAADVPALPQLDQAWVQVVVGDRERWLDPTASLDAHNAYDLAGHAVLAVGTGGGLRTLPALTAGENRAALRVALKVADGGHELLLSGTADLDLSTGYNPLVAYDRSSSRQAGVAAGVAGGFGGATVDETFVGRQTCGLTSLRTDFSGGRLEVPEHGVVRIELPRVPGAITGSSLGIHRGARTMPLVVSAPATETVALEIELPAGYLPAFVPSEVTLSNSAGSVKRTVALEAGKLSIETSLVLESAVVEPDAYPGLRALLDAVEGETVSVLLLRRAD